MFFFLCMLMIQDFGGKDLDPYIEICKNQYHFCRDKFYCVMDLIDSELKYKIPEDVQGKCIQECETVKPCARRIKCIFRCILEEAGVFEAKITPDVEKMDNNLDILSFLLLIFSLIGVIAIISLCCKCFWQQNMKPRID